MNTKQLSCVLHKLLEKSGLSIAKLSVAMNLHPATLGTYFRCEVKNPSMEVLTAIADYMGISLDELLAKISDKPTSVKEKPLAYKLQSFEDVAQLVDNLTLADKKRIITYTLDKLVC